MQLTIQPAGLRMASPFVERALPAACYGSNEGVSLYLFFMANRSE